MDKQLGWGWYSPGIGKVDGMMDFLMKLQWTRPPVSAMNKTVESLREYLDPFATEVMTPMTPMTPPMGYRTPPPMMPVMPVMTPPVPMMLAPMPRISALARLLFGYSGFQYSWVSTKKIFRMWKIARYLEPNFGIVYCLHPTFRFLKPSEKRWGSILQHQIIGPPIAQDIFAERSGSHNGGGFWVTCRGEFYSPRLAHGQYHPR